MEANKTARNLLAAAIGAQEEERGRIAREMHDGPAQALASMVFRIEIIQKLMEFDGDKATDELNRLKDSLRASLNDVRKIIYDLRPLVIEEAGLSDALAGYLRSWGDKNGISVRFEWNVPRSERFPYEVETTLYRIVQESLGNTAKHSGAGSVLVAVGRSPQGYRLVIKDDGKGFDVAQQLASAKVRARFGLYGMMERVQLLGGTLVIESSEGAGTEVRAEMPEWPQGKPAQNASQLG